MGMVQFNLRFGVMVFPHYLSAWSHPYSILCPAVPRTWNFMDYTNWALCKLFPIGSSQ